MIFGVVQGLSEFLPISSSGHLLLLHRFLSLPVQDEFAFDVVLHGATGLAVVLFFWKDLLRYGAGFARSFVHPRLQDDVDQRLAWYLVIGTIPAAVAGYFFDDVIQNLLRSELVVIGMLVAVALLFIAVERLKRIGADMSELTIMDTVIIGCAQAFALIPGTSRSGITIIAGMMRGLKREQAARFSFLLSVPIIVAANAKEIMDVSRVDIPREDVIIYLIAFISSFVTGSIAIRFLLRYVANHTLTAFAIYRLCLAVGILAVFLAGR